HLGSVAAGPAGSRRSSTPSIVSVVGAVALASRVHTVTSCPAAAIATAVLRTTTFMPPTSPEPGGAKGSVCRHTTPMRSGRVMVAFSRAADVGVDAGRGSGERDRKSTRLNSSHVKISYAV